MNKLTQYSMLGSIEAVQKQLGESLGNIEVTAETRNYFVQQVQKAMNDNLTAIATSLSK